jgi:hypothetical protein
MGAVCKLVKLSRVLHSESATGEYRGVWFDEELEVRVWNIKCDETDALPCSKCEMNVCEVR